MLRAMAVEIRKWRRTPFALVTLAGILAGPALHYLMYLLTDRVPQWEGLMQDVLMFHGMLLGPLVATLIGAQLISAEYQWDTWKLSLTAPIPRRSVYLGKWAVSVLWLLLLGLVNFGAALAVGALSGAQGPLDLPHWLGIFTVASLILATMLPLYNLVTLVTRSFFFTSGVGIVLTIAGILVVQSKYQGLYPITGSMTITGVMMGQPAHPEILGSMPVWIAMQAGVALVGLVLSTWYVAKADYR